MSEKASRMINQIVDEVLSFYGYDRDMSVSFMGMRLKIRPLLDNQLRKLSGHDKWLLLSKVHSIVTEADRR